MKKIFLFLLLLICLIGVFLNLPALTFAQCDSDTCTKEWRNTCHTNCKYVYGGGKECTTSCHDEFVCVIPQKGGGSCACCDDGACIFGCGGGGGGGGGDSECPDEACNGGETCTTCPQDCGACCGNGICGDPGELCATCPADCGSCCGNGSCTDAGEACDICVADCGICTGTVRARATLVPDGTIACSTVQSSTKYLSADILLSPDDVTKTTAEDGSFAKWANSRSGEGFRNKTLTSMPPSEDYVLAQACWERDSPAAQNNGLSARLFTDSTLTWQLGYTAGMKWFQAQGGDVYAGTSIRSYIPVGVVGGRYFVKNGTGGKPGVVTYGSSYDFYSNTGSEGASYVSTTNWLVNETHQDVDYYALMYHRFGSPTTADYAAGTTLSSKPASRATPYYVPGNLTIDTAVWTVTAGQSIVFLVDGDLTINQRITIDSGGFAAFIVKGNITIGSSVGTSYASATPVIEGVYIANGTFNTGASTTAAARRFVGEGTFVAGNFLLSRDLDAVFQNVGYASELFIYNPELLIRMPDKMKEMPVNWEEVAP